VFPSTKTIRSENTQLSLIKVRAFNILSIVDLIRLNTITTLPGIVKQISRPTICILESNRVSFVLISSSAKIVKITIKLTPTLAYFGDITSTRSSIWRNIKNFETPEISQFT